MRATHSLRCTAIKQAAADEVVHSAKPDCTRAIVYNHSRLARHNVNCPHQKALIQRTRQEKENYSTSLTVRQSIPGLLMPESCRYDMSSSNH